MSNNQVKFNDLNEDVKQRRCVTPLLAPSTKNPDEETREQVGEIQEKFLQLPENIKNKLVSHETAEKIERIGKHYDLELLQIASIARMIRNYYFGTIGEDDFSEVLIEEAEIDKQIADEIASYVLDRIINTEVKSRAEKADTVKMTVSQAMEKYPKIQDQIISENLIKLSSKEYLVKGSIRNWIKDYYSVVGAGAGDVMKISGYIYHSQNAKNTSSTEKQKLSIILKSLTNNEPVVVDADKKEIVFDIRESANDTVSPQEGVSTGVENNKQENKLKEKKETLPKENIIKNSNYSIGNQNSLNDRGIKKEQKTQDPPKNINHVRGNSFNLRSDYFEKSNSKKEGVMSKLLGKKNRKNENRKKENKEDNIKFSTPQELPVEKEQKKEKQKDNFFGTIKPID